MQEIVKRCIHKLWHMKIHHHFATAKDKKKNILVKLFMMISESKQ